MIRIYGMVGLYFCSSLQIMMVSGTEPEDDASTDEVEAEDLKGELQDQGFS